MIELSNANSKKGVIDALSILISSKSRPIRIKSGENDENSLEQKLKMPKNVEIVNVNEEEQEEETPETDEEKEGRLSRIKQANSDEEITKDIQNAKNDQDKIKAAQERIAKEQEEKIKREEKRKNAPLVAKGKIRLDFNDFEKDLEEAIMSQILTTKEDESSYKEYNSTYANSDLLMPGSIRKEKKAFPIINVYFDLSGSCSSQVEATRTKLQFLNKLKDDDVLDYTVYYFAGEVSKNPAEVGRGTTAFPKILQHVKKTGATNVIIVTDDDFDSQSGDISDLPFVKVEGCVWWMWAYDSMAKKAWPHLTSIDKLATFHYKV